MDAFTICNPNASIADENSSNYDNEAVTGWDKEKYNDDIIVWHGEQESQRGVKWNDEHNNQHSNNGHIEAAPMVLPNNQIMTATLVATAGVSSKNCSISCHKGLSPTLYDVVQ